MGFFLCVWLTCNPIFCALHFKVAQYCLLWGSQLVGAPQIKKLKHNTILTHGDQNSACSLGQVVLGSAEKSQVHGPGVVAYLLGSGCLVAVCLCVLWFAPSLFSHHFPMLISWIFPILDLGQKA